jgi:predicted nucleic acid-binding protein
MNLVCNAGPAIALAKIDKLALLPRLYASVSIPETVFHELLAKPGEETDRILHAVHSFLKVSPPPASVQPGVTMATRHLDAGEREVIHLASSFHPSATVLLDDAAGRRVATYLEVPVTGFAGILVVAKRRCFVGNVVPLVEQARSKGYWLSDELIETVRNLAEE